jgi:hypothetical protein
MTVFEAFQVSLLARYVTGTAPSRTLNLPGLIQ